jgi:hypothetical protein
LSTEDAPTIGVGSQLAQSKEKSADDADKTTAITTKVANTSRLNEDSHNDDDVVANGGLGIIDVNKTRELLERELENANNKDDHDIHIEPMPPLTGEAPPATLTTNNDDAVSAISSFYSSKGENASERKTLINRATKYIR